MSLRVKIVVLFLGLAVVPLLVVAAVGYWQASRVATDIVGGALEEAVGQTVGGLESELRSLDSRLERLARSPVTRALVSGSLDAEAWERQVAAELGNLAFAEVSTPDAGRVAAAGVRPSGPVRCRAEFGARLVTARRPVESSGAVEGQVEVGVWADDLLAAAGGVASAAPVVFRSNNGQVLLSRSCAAVEDGLPASLLREIRSQGAMGARLRQLTYEEADGDRLAVVAGLSGRPWSVAASTSTSQYMAPLQRLQASYSMFVLLLALATGLAFSLFLRRVVQSLEELTDVASRIGEGDLNPWLPPPTDDEVGRLSLAFSAMLDRLRQMMQRVDQSGRLAVVGQLTSYLAHEIRNPLSSIRMNLQSLQREARQGRIPDDAGESIDISLREVDRLSASLTSVLQLGRPASGPGETVGVHDVVQEAAELLSGELRRAGVELTLDLDAGADRVVSVPGQLKGVFLNLMMNAIEAQPDGGRLDVRSRLVGHPDEGPTVAVYLRDLGRGVPSDLRARIFEPFFSTRKQGSGIGLAVALRTVREHGGNLYLADLPESATGSEFVVELPLAAVISDTGTPATVHLPPWMETDPGNPGERDETPSPSLRAFIALSDTDPGDLH